ncbi:unnamed protein product [Heterosigma akashiwo]
MHVRVGVVDIGGFASTWTPRGTCSSSTTWTGGRCSRRWRHAGRRGRVVGYFSLGRAQQVGRAALPAVTIHAHNIMGGGGERRDHPHKPPPWSSLIRLMIPLSAQARFTVITSELTEQEVKGTPPPPSSPHRQVRPENPEFSSGPCKKRPGYDLRNLYQQALGRSHRSKLGKGRLQYSIELSKQLLRLPEDYRLGIVPASDTGAFEMAMWSMLGPRPVDMCYWESLGRSWWGRGDGWFGDATSHLGLQDVTEHAADYGHLPDLSKTNPDSDICFTWAAPPGREGAQRTGSPPDRWGSPSATPPRPPSPWRSTGPRWTCSPTAGRRCWAARAATACWCCPPAPWSGLSPSPRPTARCPRSSA